jgi:hypothetical protein
MMGIIDYGFDVLVAPQSQVEFLFKSLDGFK